MGLQEDFKDLAEKFQVIKKDPERLKNLIAVASLVVGFVLVKMPLSSRIESKFTELRQAKIVAKNAEDFDTLDRGVEAFSHRLNYPNDGSDWQKYYYKLAAETGVGITRWEQAAVDMVYDAAILNMPVTIVGSYAQIVAFIDAVERGQRLARVDEMRLSLAEGKLTLRCVLMGLCIEDFSGDGDDEEEDYA